MHPVSFVSCNVIFGLLDWHWLEMTWVALWIMQFSFYSYSWYDAKGSMLVIVGGNAKVSCWQLH